MIGCVPKMLCVHHQVVEVDGENNQVCDYFEPGGFNNCVYASKVVYGPRSSHEYECLNQNACLEFWKSVFKQ
jgi:hypothetical protein